MRGIDTNVVVRLLTADDPVQAQAARRVVAAGDVFLPITVLLETEWVLRAGYGFAPGDIVRALTALAGLPGVTVEDPAQLALALGWLDGGMDFADALHLARSGDCEAFVTFDRAFVKRARSVSALPVVEP